MVSRTLLELRRRSRINAIAIVVAFACAGCGRRSSPTPAAPTPPTSAAVAAVAVTGSPATTDTFQLTAIARFTDGTALDVTSAAGWESSNTAIATVSATGLVAIHGTGDVDLLATYQAVTGSTQLFVAQSAPTKVTLSGMVREAGTRRLLPGVRILVNNGPDAGAIAISDEGGLYTFPSLSLSSVIVLEASKDGYQTGRVLNLNLSSNRTDDFTLYPIPPHDANGVDATARCNDQSWSWAQTSDEACTNHGGVAYPVCPGPLCE